MTEAQKREFEKALWGIANDLRGKMDADEFRDYIIAFIFYKYLSERISLYADGILEADGITFGGIEEGTPEGDEVLEAVRSEAIDELGYFQCNNCRGKFTVRTGTIMARSHVPLHKWLLATHLTAASKKGMSAKQMERMLGVTYKTAWFLCHRIREAMDGAAPSGPLGGPGEIVEADETYVGGKAKNRAYPAPAPKKPVVALVPHEGHVKSFHVANVTAKNVRPLIVAHVDRQSHLITDESPIHTRLGREFTAHSTVNHSAGEYVTRGGLKHTNTVEGFFSIFKRGVIGTYHHMSEAHLGRYCAEFDLRYNTREMTDGERGAVILKGGEGRRLTYRRADRLAA